MGDVTENWVAVVATPFSLRLPVASDYDVGTVTQSVLHVHPCVHMIEHIVCLKFACNNFTAIQMN